MPTPLNIGTRDIPLKLAEAITARVWEYVLLGENHFYALKNNNASISDICESVKITEAEVRGKLFI